MSKDCNLDSFEDLGVRNKFTEDPIVALDDIFAAFVHVDVSLDKKLEHHFDFVLDQRSVCQLPVQEQELHEADVASFCDVEERKHMSLRCHSVISLAKGERLKQKECKYLPAAV